MDRRGPSDARREVVYGIALFAALVALRVYALGADPPQDLEYHFLTDEGWWSHNARLHALFGHWILDDHNPALFGAPLYTLVLRGVYAIAGVGLVQTRVLAAASGVATCAVIYALARSEAGPAVARVCTLLFGFGYFVLSYHRVAFVETFELLFITATFAALVWARRHLVWAAAAGLLFVLSVLAKASAIASVPAIVLFWAAQAVRTRFDREKPFRISGPLVFGAVAGTVSLVIAATLVRPYWDLVRTTFAAPLNTMAMHANPISQIGGFALTHDWYPIQWGPFAASGFLAQTVPLVLLGGVLLAHGIAARRPAHVDDLDLACAAWLVAGVGWLAPQVYVPDRRLLVLLPPLAILVGRQLVQHGGLPIPSRGEIRAAGGRWRAAALGAWTGWIVGFYLRPFFVPTLVGVFAGVPIGEQPGISDWFAACLVWAAAVALGAASAPLWTRLLPRSPRTLRLAWILVAFLAIELGRFGLYLAVPTYTIEDASRALRDRTDAWPVEDRVAVGDYADTLSLSTRIFAFPMRDWPWIGAKMNLDGWERFHPHVAFQGPKEAWVTMGIRPDARGFERLPDLELCPDRAGTPRFRVGLWIKPPDAGPTSAP